MAWFCIAATLGKPFTIYGDGKQVRDVLWIDDLLDAYDQAIARIDRVRGQAFNVGGGPANTLSLLELLTHLEQAPRASPGAELRGLAPGRPAGLR